MKQSKAIVLVLLSVLSLLTTAEVDVEKVSKQVKNKFVEKQVSKSTILPPCQACKAMVGSFQKVWSTPTVNI